MLSKMELALARVLSRLIVTSGSRAPLRKRWPLRVDIELLPGLVPQRPLREAQEHRVGGLPLAV
jgi:hypothetical protein